MTTKNMLFKIDELVIDGLVYAIVDGSAMISGAARFRNTVEPSASGDDFNKRERVPTTVKFNLQFNESIDPMQLTKLQSVQIACRDRQSKRRAIMNNCSFGEFGEVGGGAVEVTFNVLSEIQWL